MTEVIEANFSQIKEIIEKQKNDVTKAIQQEISDLKKDLDAKNTEITNLKLKEEKLQGKNETILTLNSTNLNY